jgi:ABC-type branched-subunit amino acid transport system ATPase component
MRCTSAPRISDSSLNKDELDVLYHRFTALADRKKGVRNDEIVALLHEVVGRSSLMAAAISPLTARLGSWDRQCNSTY